MHTRRLNHTAWAVFGKTLYWHRHVLLTETSAILASAVCRRKLATVLAPFMDLAAGRTRLWLTSPTVLVI